MATGWGGKGRGWDPLASSPALTTQRPACGLLAFNGNAVYVG